MFLGIQAFDIEVDVVKLAEDLGNLVPRRGTARLNSAADPAFLRFSQKLEHEIALHQRLAARQRQSAIGSVVEHHVALNVAKNLVGGAVVAVLDDGVCRANIGAGKAVHAVVVIDPNLIRVHKSNVVVRANAPAHHANIADALFDVVGDLGLRKLRFGIAAPLAS